MSSYETLLIERDAGTGVTVLKFNRPEQRNAMSPQLHQDMTDALAELWYDDETRVLVLTGEGTAFCAGMDLKQFFLMLEDKPKEYERITALAVEWRGRTLRNFPKPTIGMINGFCFGGRLHNRRVLRHRDRRQRGDVRALRNQLRHVPRR